MEVVGVVGAHAPRGPVQRSERALAPDLARGAMLLFIALANGAGVVFGGSGFEPDPHGVERALNLLMFTAVHARAYPVFAIMFGYGLVQFARRQEAAGATAVAVRALLIRRNLSLVAFGAVHGVLLYYGDFLGAYGLVGVFASLVLLHRGDRVYRAVLWIWGVSALYTFVLALRVAAGLMDVSTLQAGVPTSEVISLVAPSYGVAVRARLTEWPVHTATVLPFITLVWLGMWAARRRLLEDLSAHRRLLGRVAGIGLGMAIAGGLPLALTSAGIVHADSASVDAMFQLHQVSGAFGGLGYVALSGLIAFGISHAPSPPALLAAGPVAALGRRSLSAYLLQSIAWVLLLAPFTLALGERFGRRMMTAMGIAFLVWLASVVAAALLDRRSHQGPAEAVLRRLTYGRSR
jgi:uncharacterized membrane protein YeiB